MAADPFKWTTQSAVHPDTLQAFTLTARRRSAETSLTSRSKLSAGFKRAGLTEVEASAKGWVEMTASISSTATVSTQTSDTELHVTGRDVVVYCTLQLAPTADMDQPHPELDADVRAMLALTNEDLNAKQVAQQAAFDGILQKWGSFYVRAVEMGGLQMASSEETVATEVASFISMLHQPSSLTLHVLIGQHG